MVLIISRELFKKKALKTFNYSERGRIKKEVDLLLVFLSVNYILWVYLSGQRREWA